ncbi:hypothetical protein MAR_001197, partial [Mya arenaria]
MHLCSLYQEDSVLDEENQNDGSEHNTCAYIKREDLEGAEAQLCDALCPYLDGRRLQVCADNACYDHDCLPIGTNVNEQLVGNVNTEGGAKTIHCDEPYWPRNDVTRSVCTKGRWTPLLQCD